MRGIALRGEKLLLVYSPIDRGFKFPGGGIKDGESHVEALNREIEEECGVALAGISGEFGRIVEYGKAKETDYDIFKQTSHYYLCTVHSEFRGQKLDEHERELGLRPEWVEISVALAKNELSLTGNFGEPPSWARRETFILRLLSEKRRQGHW